MIRCFLSCRSVTYAQKYTRLLQRHGYAASMTRLPAHMADVGCGHAVELSESQIADAVIFLRDNGALNLRVLCQYESGEYEERWI